VALSTLLLMTAPATAQTPGSLQGLASAYKAAPHGEAWREKLLRYGKRHADAYAKKLNAFDGDVEKLRATRAKEQRTSPKEVTLEYKDLTALASWRDALAAQYYDAGSVFYRNALLDPKDATYWNTIGDRAVQFYRDAYVLPAKGNVPGFQNFTDGLYLHYLRMKQEDRPTTADARTQRDASRAAIILLSKEAAFARDNTPEDTSDPLLCREVAYSMRSMMHAEAVGEPRRDRLAKLAQQALGHLELLLPKTLPAKSDDHPFTRPFMVGIVARALIDYEQLTHDSRVLPALEAAQARLWERMWDAKAGAFLYTNRAFPGEPPSDEDMKPAVDLNLMISPLYAWVGAKKKDSRLMSRADIILRSGIDQAYWEGEKQYNQQGWWSFEGIRFRASSSR